MYVVGQLLVELLRFVYLQCSVVAFVGNASLGFAFKKEYDIHRTVLHIKFMSFHACILLDKIRCLTEKPFTLPSSQHRRASRSAFIAVLISSIEGEE